MINLQCNSTASSSSLTFVGSRLPINVKPVSVRTLVSDRGSGCLKLRCEVSSDLDSRSVSNSSSLSTLEPLKTSTAERVGETIGVGVYVLVRTVAKEQIRPVITISFLIVGIVIGISTLCYAKLACRCPSGSAYHYSYLCVGEGVAWLSGWSLILEYTLGGAAVTRGISPNMEEDDTNYVEEAEVADVAKELFDTMPCKNVSSWNTMITGFAQSNLLDLARDYSIGCPQRDCIS